MITESIIKGLKNEPIKLKDETVESTNPYLPKLYFCGMWIASKGMGKTYSLCELLRYYEKSSIVDKKGRKHEMRTILFCPTGNSDFNKVYESLESLNKEDIITDYSDDKLFDVLNQIEQEEKEVKEYYKYQKAYHKFKHNHKLKDKDLLILDKYDFKDPLDKGKHNHDGLQQLQLTKPKYVQYRVNFLIFDDLVGMPGAFKRNNSRLNNLVIKTRHLHSSCLFTTQYPLAIPPVIRNNIDLWVLFRFSNKERLLKQVYTEISSLMPESSFEELYEYAIKESRHDALIVDIHPKTEAILRFRKNWNITLKIN